jgi:hypothetical protein
VRRLAATLGLALSLCACGVVGELAPSGEPVNLRTDVKDCGPNWVEGVLLSNSDYGTDIEVLSLQASSSEAPALMPYGDNGSNTTSVAWPSGFRGVHLTSGEVAVLDSAGKLVAMTGRKYRLKGAMAVAGPAGPGYSLPNGVSPLQGFGACGDPQSIIPE